MNASISCWVAVPSTLATRKTAVVRDFPILVQEYQIHGACNLHLDCSICQESASSSLLLVLCINKQTSKPAEKTSEKKKNHGTSKKEGKVL